MYSLPVYQEYFASLRPPLGGRTRLVIIILPSVSIPEGGFKNWWNQIRLADNQSRISVIIIIIIIITNVLI